MNSVGPLFALAANAIMTILCLLTSAIYWHYRPLRSLFFFNLFVTFCFFGWFIYMLQKSSASILIGYKIMFAALALLPASWFWFYSAILNDKPGKLFSAITGISLILAILAIFGRGSWLLGFPLEPDPVALNVLRPHSKLLRPLILFFCLSTCVFYFLMIMARVRRFKGKRPIYLLSIAFGLFIWFLGGLHDTLRVAGVAILVKGQVLWLASFWLSVFLTIAVTLHFRTLELAVREARDVFERFVPPAYLRRIATEGLGSIRLGQADQQWVTILCCDIRGFTSLSEQLNPTKLIAFVNRLFDRITPVVNRWQGVIDKFLGDAVLCIFEGDNSAERAVACGVDILAEVKSFRAEEDRPPDQTVKVSIGLHTGPVILGTIGSTERMDSTVLGLPVNLAKRIEEATRPLSVDMLISEQVANLLPYTNTHRLRNLGKVSIRGSLEPVSIVEVYDQDPLEIRNLKDQVKPIMAEGMELFKAGYLHEALLKFQTAQSIFPEDPPLRLFIISLQHAMEREEPKKDGVLLDFSK